MDMTRKGGRDGVGWDLVCRTGAVLLTKSCTGDDIAARCGQRVARRVLRRRVAELPVNRSVLEA